MADIAPFRGVVYSSERVAADAVLAPPYDVIDAGERDRLAARSPYNCVRLILPQGEGDAKYATAAELLSAWQAAGVLTRDAIQALYRYHQVFRSVELGDEPVTRKGFIAAVRLHRYDEGVILPHERTLKGPKIDRLKLMRATKAHLSQIFTLYSDPERKTDAAFAAAESRAADLQGTTDDGTLHRLWRVTDAAVIGAVRALLRGRPLYIADGHHRYETMLTFRDELRQAGAAGIDSPAEFGTMFLANMDDPGLIVLPTHRLVHSLAAFSRDDLLARAEATFEVDRVPGAAADPVRVRALLAGHGERGPSFAVVVPGSDEVAMLTLRPGFDASAAGLAGPAAVTRLDVSLLHRLVLEDMLGITQEAQDAQQNLAYIKDTAKALERTAAGEGQVCFLMNATRVHQVKAVSDASACMPQKSTFFYPKIASGLVIRPIEPIGWL
jgi:uncharacterized protein (DUF1015 family)